MPKAQNDIQRAYDDLKRDYDLLISYNLAGVYRTTLDGRFLECNDAMARMLGYRDRMELLQLPALELYASVDVRNGFILALKTSKKLVNYELTLKHRNGRPVEVLENVFLDERGQEATIQGTVIDITAMRQAELDQASLVASYRSLVEQMRDAVLVVQDDSIQYANPAAERLFGTSLLGMELLDLVHSEQHKAVRGVIDQLDGSKDHGMLNIALSGGRDKNVILSATRVIHDGRGAVQITLQQEGESQALLREQMRLQIAEELNTVLKNEISEHRRTQEALNNSRRFARSLVDSSLDMIMAADPDGRITEYNPAASLRFGYEAQEVLGVETNILYSDPEEYVRIQEELLKYGSFTGEVKNVTKSGEGFTSFLAASRMFDEDGMLLGAMGVSRDITRMKRDQEALVQSEERYRDLFESATNLIQSVDPDGRFQYVNAAWKKALGYSDKEIRDLVLYDIIHPDHVVDCRVRFAEIIEGTGRSTITTVFRAKDGNAVHVEGTTNVRFEDGAPVAARTILTDITHVYKAREEVRQHEAKLKALFESSEHMFWTVDPALKITSHNKSYGDMIERLYGMKPDVNKEPDRPRALFANPKYHAFWEEKYRAAFAGEVVRFETDVRDTRDERVCNEIFLSPVFDSSGKVTEVFGVGHEITEQKVAQGLVRQQTARIKAIFENAANVMIWTLDKDFRITSFNEHFHRTSERHLGRSFAAGDDFVEIMKGHLAGGPDDPVVAKYRSGAKGHPQQFEVEVVGHSGRHIWVETFLNPIEMDGSVNEISCMAYGITDRKESELRMRQSLSEKEVLLKEVHHRVKNNLQIISSIMNLQTAHVDGDERILELLQVSRDRIRSMSFIHESLYQNKDFSSIDMADYIDSLTKNLIMSYSLNGRVRLENELARVELDLDRAIPCGLVLNELISNAIKHAFPDGREGVIRVVMEQTDDLVRISVSDNGIGLPEGFNAKHDGNLGLELVRTLIEQVDGQLKVSNAPGVAYLLTFGRNK